MAMKLSSLEKGIQQQKMRLEKIVSKGAFLKIGGTPFQLLYKGLINLFRQRDQKIYSATS